MKVSVIGNGRWGSFLAWYLNKVGHNVLSCGRAESRRTANLIETRDNGMLIFPPEIKLAEGYENALENDLIFVSIPSQNVRETFTRLAKENRIKNKRFVLCMKGIEIGSGKRLSQVAQETLGSENRVSVWLGPGHVQEFVRGVPNCMVIDSEHDEEKKYLIELLHSDLIRFYYGNDLIGNEIGAAAKNVVGIAAGMLDGFGLTSLKGALMSRGTREFARLIVALGGKELSAYGLCHLGDYEATVFSEHSRNRMFGESFAKGKTEDGLAEGYYTVEALLALSQQAQVELPISMALYNVLYKNEPAQEALDALFSRSLKEEFA